VVALFGENAVPTRQAQVQGSIPLSATRTSEVPKLVIVGISVLLRFQERGGVTTSSTAALGWLMVNMYGNTVQLWLASGDHMERPYGGLGPMASGSQEQQLESPSKVKLYTT
jgi:hypothetical protein